MYEVMDGLISIAGGSYAYLAAVGKIQISKSEEKTEKWRAKYGMLVKILAPILIAFGVFRLSRSFLGIA
ncbi:hypothetical protein [Marinobacterium mangrovicola]|uniref:Uncharacterized protein n=1 Tax=Marinobacterium mangrovicola TaxID=1476959 RepID=A0A4R1G7Z2_9GAMM|nr:hypothetical protein [Marinobacterium mangrovicola]TCK02585.1 hypothetical protein CLV83_4281 [Marinobacterium mangrovicola]